MFQWDEEKNGKNRKKHGVDFQEASTIFESAVYVVDTETLDGELRYKSYGQDASGKVLCVIHTDRDHSIRIISARKATPKEQKQYWRYFEDANR